MECGSCSRNPYFKHFPKAGLYLRLCLQACGWVGGWAAGVSVPPGACAFLRPHICSLASRAHRRRAQFIPFRPQQMKEEQETLRESLFQPVTEQAHGWGKVVCGALCFKRRQKGLRGLGQASFCHIYLSNWKFNSAMGMLIDMQNRSRVPRNV